LSLRAHTAHPIVVVALTLSLLPACSGEETSAPVGIYAAACDPLATIDFKPGGVAEINRNYCEGYAVEAWSYALEGDALQLAPEGKLGDPGTVHVEFRVSGPAELTPTSESGFLTCNNCAGSEVWLKQ
jgi:hypothetical protein